MTQFVCNNWSLLCESVLLDEVIKIAGPLYNVTVNAPAIDTMVPIDLARLLSTLKFSFSMLKKHHKITMNQQINHENCCIIDERQRVCLYRNHIHWCLIFQKFVKWENREEPHPENMARMKVKAGVRSPIAEDRVGELYPIHVYIQVCIECEAMLVCKRTLFHSFICQYI